MAALSPVTFLRRRFQSKPKDNTSTYSLDNVSEEENKKLKEDDTLFEFKDNLESHADNSRPTASSVLSDDDDQQLQKGNNELSHSSTQETSEWTIKNRKNSQHARLVYNPVDRTSEKPSTPRRPKKNGSRVSKGSSKENPKGTSKVNMRKKQLRSDDGEQKVGRGQNDEQSKNQSNHEPLLKDYQAFGDTKRTEFNILDLYTAKVRARSQERGPEVTPSDVDIVKSLFDIAQETRESESPSRSDEGRKEEGTSVDPLSVSQRSAAADQAFCFESPGKRRQETSVDYRSFRSTIRKERSSSLVASKERLSRSSDDKERSSHTLIDKENSSRTLVFKGRSSATEIDAVLSPRRDNTTSLGTTVSKGRSSGTQIDTVLSPERNNLTSLGVTVSKGRSSAPQIDTVLSPRKDITSLGTYSSGPKSFILGSTHLEVTRKASTCKTEGSSVDRKRSFSQTCLPEGPATTDQHEVGSSVDSPVITPYQKAKFRKTKLRAFTQVDESETDHSLASVIPQTSEDTSSDDVPLTDPRPADSQFFVVNKATVERLLSFGSHRSKVDTLNVSTSTPKLTPKLQRQSKKSPERHIRTGVQPHRFTSGLVLNGMCSKCKTSCRAAASVLKDVCAPCRDKCQRLGVKPDNLCMSCREKCKVLGLVLDNLCHSCKDELRALNVIKQELCTSCQVTCRQVTLIVDNMCEGCREDSRALKSLYKSRATKCRAMGAILEDNMCKQCRSKFRSLRDMTRRRIHSVRKKDFALDEIKKDLCQFCEEKVAILFDINSTADDITGDSFMEKVSLKMSKASSSCKESIGNTIRRLEFRVREELAEEILAEMIETPLSPIAPGDSHRRKDGEKIEDAGMYLAYAVIVIIVILNFVVYATFDGVGSYVPYFPST